MTSSQYLTSSDVSVADSMETYENLGEMIEQDKVLAEPMKKPNPYFGNLLTKYISYFLLTIPVVRLSIVKVRLLSNKFSNISSLLAKFKQFRPLHWRLQAFLSGIPAPPPPDPEEDPSHEPLYENIHEQESLYDVPPPPVRATPTPPVPRAGPTTPTPPEQPSLPPTRSSSLSCRRGSVRLVFKHKDMLFCHQG